jgi:hypothetical protein
MQGFKEKIQRFKQLKDNKKELEDQIKLINKEVEEIKEELIPIMVNEDMQNVTYPEIGKISLKTKKFPRIIDQQRFFDYLYATEQDALIKTSVNTTSLGAWFREAGITLNPEEIGLEVYEEIDITLTKG